MSFMTWSSKTWTQVKMIVKTWQLQVWNPTPFFHDLACQVLKRCIVATPCPQVSTMVALFKTWLSKSSNFSVSRIWTLDSNKNFHDLVFQDVTTSERDCQDLAATGLKSYICLSRPGLPSLETLRFVATPCPQVLTMIALLKTWLSKSWFFLRYRISTV